MNDSLQNPKIKAILWIVGGLIVLLVVFGSGILLGYQRAIFASRFGENYYNNFYGPQASTMGRMPTNMHGVAGEVLDVASSTLSVKDNSGNEQSVIVDSDTAIRKLDQMIVLSDIQVGDQITVIGAPNAQGQIEARFIRVFNSSSSLPTPPPPAPTQNAY